jgi:hypothetical protein
MAKYNRKKSGKITYGKAFKKQSKGGKFKKGTWIKYKYNSQGRRVGAVKSKSRR